MACPRGLDDLEDQVNDTEARERFAGARVARLATVRASGAPHLVPVTFALVEDVSLAEDIAEADGGGSDRPRPAGTIVTAVDHKPKRSGSLLRLANIEHDPRVTLLVDHYDEDWTRLWWVRADGRARVVTAGPERDAAVRALTTRYTQYRRHPPAGPAIIVEVDRWSSWCWDAGQPSAT